MVFTGYQDEPVSKTSVVLSIEETRYKKGKKKSTTFKKSAKQDMNTTAPRVDEENQ